MLTKQLTFFLLTIICALTARAQDNPYAIFGHESEVVYESQESDLIRVFNADTNSRYRTMVFDYLNLNVKLLDDSDSIVENITIRSNSTLRFMSVDPHEKNYPGLSPYNFVGNMPVRAVDPDGQDIYVLFYTTGNKGGDEIFEASALTRKSNIENSESFDSETDKVIVLELTDISDIEQQMEAVVTAHSEQYGQTREVGVWSHSGWDGPMGTEATSNSPLYSSGETFRGRYRRSTSPQMSLTGWSQVDFNWIEEGASCTFYGCNSGSSFDPSRGEINSFANNVSTLDNFENVQVAGQTTSSYPSFSPTVRATTLARSKYPGVAYEYGERETYMVGGNSQEGWRAMWFTPSLFGLIEYPEANELEVNWNGYTLDYEFQSTSAENPIQGQ